MQKHPVLQLVRSFTPAEHKAFAKKVLHGTRSGNLYHLLKKENTPDKKQVFRKIFGEDYSKEKDYLLRNELSILRLRLQEFILENIPADDTTPQKRWDYYRLGEWLYQRRLPGLARETIEKSLHLATRHEDWELLIRLNRLLVVLDQSNIDGLADRIDAVQQSITAHENYIRRLFTRENRYITYLHGLHIKLLKLAGQPFSSLPDPTDADIIFAEHETSMSAFLREKGMAYAENSAASVPFLEKALMYLEKMPSSAEVQTQWFICAGQIASEYSATGNFTAAEYWFHKILATPGLENHSGSNFLVMNYMTTLVKLRKWQEALNLAGILERSATEEYIIKRLSAAKISCYIFLRDTAQLKKLLPKDFSELDTDVRHYYRMQYSIYWYLCGNTEEAEREMQNLSLNKQAIQSNYKPLISLLLLFYQAMADSGNQKPAQKWIQKLQKKHTEFHDHALPAVKTMVPAIWLTEEISKIIPH